VTSAAGWRRAATEYWSRRTLRGWVSTLAIGVIAGWLAVLAVGLNYVLEHSLGSQANDALRVRAQAASANLLLDRTGAIRGVRDSATDAELDASTWIYAGTRAVERPHDPGELQAVADALARRNASGFRSVGESYKIYAMPVENKGHRVGTVVAAVSLAPYKRAEHVTLALSAVVGGLVLLGAYPVLRLTAGRALRPVEAMTRQAADWTTHTPGQRFGGGQAYVELRTLAGTLDGLLDRYSAVLRHERTLSAELSHELRTPLATLSAETDLLIAAPGIDEPTRQALLRIREQAATMDRTIDTLLLAARADLRGSTGVCALDLVLDRLEVAGPPRIRVDGTGLTVGVEAELVERILAPVVANARRFARTEVTITARAAASGVAIDIANDGPPLPDDDRLFDPGHRGVEQLPEEPGQEGSGLGLALARRLARSADGDVEIVARDPATFRVWLPGGGASAGAERQPGSGMNPP
jgi:signal transduction histidine kinase